ncbi:MBL fold metallo-hydrolase [Sinorhizobium fredii]|uniref:Metallo-beta-lactamase family hydrolase protein n=1 Tax=Rhizobium fredii TaxID=380 RepID=A0A2L0HDC2_RHIFR|nr:MBL fold metallo-hydrolase [Sinorhizobium fredii]AUX79465.1 metallo-beta-lactamase family hydrolase protein [Sinorhizobium fredii]
MGSGRFEIDRRNILLAGGSAFGGAVLGATGIMPPAEASSVPAAQGPDFYRFAIGDAQVTVVSDGPLPLGDPTQSFLGVPADEIRSMLTHSFLPINQVVLAQNAPVVNISGKLILFDTGMGSLKQFGPTTGRLKSCLAAANIALEDIDAVVCSHAHWDHVGGIWGDDGKPTFPNAQVYISQTDYEFWTDEKKLGGELDGLVKAAIHNLKPVRDRIVFFNDEREFLPGIHAISAPGHTLGHSCFIIESAGKTMCYGGDLTHHPVLLFEKPLMEFAFDTDPKLSAQSRVRILKMLASNRIPFMSYHFPWPGYGHVGIAGEGFEYFPEQLHLSLLE